MQQLLIFLAGPFGLLDARIQPFVPTRLALFGRLTMQQRGNTTPLIFAIFHYGRLENLILEAKACFVFRMLRISVPLTSVLRQTPPFIIIRGILLFFV